MKLFNKINLSTKQKYQLARRVAEHQFYEDTQENCEALKDVFMAIFLKEIKTGIKVDPEQYSFEYYDRMKDNGELKDVYKSFKSIDLYDIERYIEVESENLKHKHGLGRFVNEMIEVFSKVDYSEMAQQLIDVKYLAEKLKK